MHSILDNRKVLIVEDNRTMSESIALFLDNAGATTTRAFDGKAALAAVSRQQFDAIVLDWMVPGPSGLQLFDALQQISNAPVLFLTARTQEENVVSALQAGAADYMRKPFGGKELVARLARCIESGLESNQRHDAHWVFGDVVVDCNSHTACAGGVEQKLTRTEYRILGAMIAAPNVVFSRARLIELAFGEAFDGYDRTVDAHVSNLRRKLGESSRAQRHIVTEIGFGYRFVP